MPKIRNKLGKRSFKGFIIPHEEFVECSDEIAKALSSDKNFEIVYEDKKEDKKIEPPPVKFEVEQVEDLVTKPDELKEETTCEENIANITSDPVTEAIPEIKDPEDTPMSYAREKSSTSKWRSRKSY